MTDMKEASNSFVLMNEVGIETDLKATTLEDARKEGAKIALSDARSDEPCLHTYWLDVSIQWIDDRWPCQEDLVVQVDPLPPPCEDGGPHEWDEYNWEEHESETYPDRRAPDRYRAAMRVFECETETCECGWMRHNYRNIQRSDGGGGVHDAIEYVRR